MLTGTTECKQLLLLSLKPIRCIYQFFVIVFQGVQTDLDKYVQSDDGYFSWSVLNYTELENATFYVVNMTSQKWFDGKALHCMADR
jgi:hypothetical protein